MVQIKVFRRISQSVCAHTVHISPCLIGTFSNSDLNTQNANIEYHGYRKNNKLESFAWWQRSMQFLLLWKYVLKVSNAYARINENIRNFVSCHK